MPPKISDILALPFAPLQAMGLPTPFVTQPKTQPSTPPPLPGQEPASFSDYLSPAMIFQTVSGFKTKMEAIAAPEQTIEGQIVPTGYPIARPKTVTIPQATVLVDGLNPNPRANRGGEGLTTGPSELPLSQRTGARRIAYLGGY